MILAVVGNPICQIQWILFRYLLIGIRSIKRTGIAELDFVVLFKKFFYSLNFR
jgi:hypothetical protein